MAGVIYNSFRRDIMNGSVDLDTDTTKVMAVTSISTPDQNACTTRPTTTNEVPGTAYSVGAQPAPTSSIPLTTVKPRSVRRRRPDVDDVHDCGP
jgi:hypothetical protein